MVASGKITNILLVLGEHIKHVLSSTFKHHIEICAFPISSAKHWGEWCKTLGRANIMNFRVVFNDEDRTC
jgi:hypothetical protein